jgi:hypothetical protein
MKNYNLEKHKRVIRDVYTGKIIKSKEAISIENIEMALEKEAMNRE